MEGVEIREERGDAAPELRRPHWEWKKDPPCAALVAYGPSAEGSMIPASCLRLFSRRLLSPGGTGFGTFGVGGVFTADAWRGRRLASRLLEEASIVALDRGACMLALYSVYGRDLYARAGFVAVRQANDREHLWVKSLDPGLSIQPGEWRVVPEAHF